MNGKKFAIDRLACISALRPVATFVCAATAAMMPTAVFAQTKTGNDLLAMCRQSETAPKTRCLDFINGVIQGYSVGYDNGFLDAFGGLEADDPRFKKTEAKRYNSIMKIEKAGHFESPYCPRPDITFGQIQDVVAKYLSDNPEKRDQPAATLVIDALKIAFPIPCTLDENGSARSPDN